MSKRTLAFAGLVAVSIIAASGAQAAGHCAAGKTLEDGVLTIATGNPAYFPWVIDDNPAGGKGFEAAVAYAVAAEMGFEASKVSWVGLSFLSSSSWANCSGRVKLVISIADIFTDTGSDNPSVCHICSW